MGAIITIDGQPAKRSEDGARSEDGWDWPGDHLVDVVPRPSATYRILQDPWSKDGWETLTQSVSALSGCSMGHCARPRRRGVRSGRKICRGGRCDSLSSLPWTSVRRRRPRTPQARDDSETPRIAPTDERPSFEGCIGGDRRASSASVAPEPDRQLCSGPQRLVAPQASTFPRS